MVIMHELKILPEYFIEVFVGEKLFELRKNDRKFQRGDFVKLREWINGKYTGSYIVKRITYVLEGGEYGLDKEYVIFSLTEKNFDSEIVCA